MPRLFVFAVGGTGARVMRALAMLISAGELADYEVVPILIDYDVLNGDLNNTYKQMCLYKGVHEKVYGDGIIMPYNGMVSPTLTPVMSFSPNNAIVGSNSFMMDMHMPYHHMRGGDVIGYPKLTENEHLFRLLLDSLFTTGSYGELSQDLCVGFKGNAKIARLGYAALKIQESIEFRTFLNVITPNRDRIVVVGSTFGGTGSVGVLEILKQLRYGQHIPINNIATVLVEPYFLPQIAPAMGVGDSRPVFAKRSREFLKFYMESGLAGIVNATYRIGMDDYVIYETAIGGPNQRNIAHPVELLSAMVICEYATTGQEGTFEYHYGRNNLQFVNERIDEHDFYQLPNGRMTLELLGQLVLAAKFYNEYFWNDNRITNSYFFRELCRNSALDRSFCDQLHDMFAETVYWIEEMSKDTNNKYALRLFNMDAPLEDTIIGHLYNPNRRGFLAHFFRQDIVRDYIDSMNRCYHAIRNEAWFSNASSEQIFIRLLSESSRNIYYNFNV